MFLRRTLVAMLDGFKVVNMQELMRAESKNLYNVYGTTYSCSHGFNYVLMNCTVLGIVHILVEHSY